MSPGLVYYHGGGWTVGSVGKNYRQIPCFIVVYLPKMLMQQFLRQSILSDIKTAGTIFSSAWLCQQSSWNRNSSVVRPSVTQLSLNLMRLFLYNFGCCFPWAIRPDVCFWIFETFGIFEILKIEILTFFFVFVNMGPKERENFKMLLLLQIVAESFHTFPEFSSQWSSQNYVWNFWNFEFPIFNEFFFRKFQIHHNLYPMKKPENERS